MPAEPVAPPNLLPLSGDSRIDMLVQGSYWLTGPDRVITYSLSLNDPGQPGGAWTPALTDAIERALAEWSNVADIVFVEAGSGTEYKASTADIAIALTGNEQGSSNAGTFYPDGGLYSLFEYPNPEGDVFIDNYDSMFTLLEPGQWGFSVLLHELGHALGLKHGHEDGERGRPTAQDLGIQPLDNRDNTLMSYSSTGDAGLTGGNAATPLLFDILAIQYIYGANMSAHTGDDLYVLQVDGAVRAIWDAGGIDTLDASGLPMGLAIDLHGGASVSYGTSSSKAVTVIAYDVDIENAVGTAFDDTITGNTLANILDGRAGNDLLEGGLGGDTYLYSLGGGEDIIEDHDASGSSGVDVLQLGAGILPGDLQVLRQDDDLLLWIDGNAQDRLELSNSADAGYRIEEIRFDDGTVWNWTTLEGHISRSGSYPDVIASPGSVIVNRWNMTHSLSLESLLEVTDADGDPIVGYQFRDQPFGGALVVNGTTQFADQNIYVAAADLANVFFRSGESLAAETVWVRASDGYGWTEWASIAIATVANPNPLPVVLQSNAFVALGESVALATLFSTTDADGDAISGLQIRDNGVGGGYFTYDGFQQDVGSFHAFSLSDIGHYRYVGSGSAGSETFSIAVYDGEDWSDIATFTLTTALMSTTGTGGNDTLIGTDGDDHFIGGSGDDLMVGRNGSDQFATSSGADAGNDTLLGGAGNDFLTDLSGTNVLDGGEGDDGFFVFLSSLGTNTYIGGAGSDLYDISVEIFASVTDSIADFAAGAAGDRLQLSAVLDTAENFGYTGGNPFHASVGVLRFVTAGADTILQFDRDGLGASYGWIDVLTLESVSSAAIVSQNLSFLVSGSEFLLISPDGSPVTGRLLEGLPSEETLVGGFFNDQIFGREGNDRLEGRGGDDLVDGGAGNDTLLGGAGVNTLRGGPGNDTYVLDSLGDSIAELGNEGTDTVETAVQVSDNYVLAPNVENLILTGTGNLNGAGNSGNNTITGTSGSNVLDGGEGNDTLVGNGGDDSFLGREGADSYDGGTGVDTVYFINPGAGSAVRIADMLATLDQTRDATGDTYAGVERLWSLDASVNDSFRGTAADDVIVTGGGDDDLVGRQGADVLDGGDGFDTVWYESIGGTGLVVDWLLPNASTGEAHNDILVAIERIYGAGFNDEFRGGNGNEHLAGGGGDDILDGRPGDDILDGGPGNDIFIGGLGRDVYIGQGGNDRYIITSAAESTVANPDIVVGFETGIDKLDLTLARTGVSDTYGFVATSEGKYLYVDLGGNGAWDIAVDVRGAIVAADLLW